MIPVCPPRHGPQHGADTKAPASTNILSNPSSSALEYTSLEAGITNILVPLATFLPFNILAASLKSLILPLVQDPRNTWSIS